MVSNQNLHETSGVFKYKWVDWINPFCVNRDREVFLDIFQTHIGWRHIPVYRHDISRDDNVDVCFSSDLTFNYLPLYTKQQFVHNSFVYIYSTWIPLSSANCDMK